MTEKETQDILVDIRNWIRAAAFTQVRSLLEAALPDKQARIAYQLLDGNTTLEQVRTKSKMSPNKLVALAQRWTAMGVMEITEDKKKRRLFDLHDFGLIAIEEDE